MSKCPHCKRKLKRSLERRNNATYKILRCGNCGYEKGTIVDAYSPEFMIFL